MVCCGNAFLPSSIALTDSYDDPAQPAKHGLPPFLAVVAHHPNDPGLWERCGDHAPPRSWDSGDVGDPLYEQAETMAALSQVIDAAGPYLDRLPARLVYDRTAEPL